MKIDKMNYAQCWDLWDKINRNPVITARSLFPKKPPLYVATTKLVAGYAANKGTALGLMGKLKTAGEVEREEINKKIHTYIKIADRIYWAIPEWAREINIKLKEK
jgi:hypothetical protein